MARPTRDPFCPRTDTGRSAFKMALTLRPLPVCACRPLLILLGNVFGAVRGKAKRAAPPPPAALYIYRPPKTIGDNYAVRSRKRGLQIVRSALDRNATAPNRNVIDV